MHFLAISSLKNPPCLRYLYRKQWSMLTIKKQNKPRMAHKRRSKPMIIQSDSVQMKSASSYAATSQVATRVSTQSVLMTAAGGQLFANTNLGKNKDNRSSAEDIRNRFLQTQNVRGVQNKDSNTKSLAQIQQETLDYLLLYSLENPRRTQAAFGTPEICPRDS